MFKSTARRIFSIPDSVGIVSGLWQRLTFSDVNPLMDELRNRAAQRQDVEQLVWVRRISTDRHDYPPDFGTALPDLRSSVMKTVARCEKISLLKMFTIHLVDVLFSIAAALMAIAVLKIFEDNSPSATLQQKIAVSLALAAGVFALNVFAAVLHAQKIERETLVVFRVQAHLTRWLNEYVLNMARDAKARWSTADVVNLAQTDARHIAEYYAHAAVDFPVLFVSSSLIVFIMWTMLGPAAFVALLILLLQIPVSLFFSWLGRRFHRELMRRSDLRLSLVTEWIQAARLVRYFGWSGKFVNDISSAARREFRQDLKIKAHYSSSFALSTSWWMLVALGVFAGFLWFHSGRSATQVFAAIWLSSILGQQLNPLPWFVRILSEARVGGERMEKIFRQPLQTEQFKVEGEEQKRSFPFAAVDVVDAENISFVLEGLWVEWPEHAAPVLKDISCRIPAACLTAIVGPVGAGKSVLIQTLMGEITPTRGRVELHADVLLKDGRRESVRRTVHCRETLELLRRIQTFVPQEAFVAAATVRENIPLRYFSEEDLSEMSDSRVVSALEKAQLAEDVFALPSGLSTELGERGVNLSGGQKQRLSLARAEFAARKLILLDDPLSAVDTRTEDILFDDLLSAEWGAPATLIWATHRLAHLKRAGFIIVLDGGQIAELGTWETLSQKGTRLSKILARGGA
jgi:ABC-type multidrug transport system fused ATPase/permease subunit